MPSDGSVNGSPTAADARVVLALGALARQIAAFRSFAASAVERGSGCLAAGGGIDRARLELGEFAAGRVDVERFARLSAGAALDATTRGRISRAVAVLQEIAAADDRQFVIDVPPGSPLSDTVESALARLGRTFGAAGAIELARAGRYRAEHDTLLEELPVASWSKSERRLAPPLVVTVDGDALQAGALGDLVDGGLKLVLLPRGACGAAPLARAITPGSYIAQTGDAGSLERFAASDAPGILALVPESAAEFVHDPSGGPQSWQRLRVTRRPAADPRRPLGARSAWQLSQELHQLYALAERPSLPEVPLGALVANAENGAPDPADRLASWLLEHADLADVG